MRDYFNLFHGTAIVAEAMPLIDSVPATSESCRDKSSEFSATGSVILQDYSKQLKSCRHSAEGCLFLLCLYYAFQAPLTILSSSAPFYTQDFSATMCLFLT
jgi:hypothetical protein